MIRTWVGVGVAFAVDYQPLNVVFPAFCNCLIIRECISGTKG